jgi:uncharacterized membrane protein
MLWFFYSALTSLLFVGMILCVRRLTDLGFPSKQILTFLFTFLFIGFLAINISSLHTIFQSKNILFFVLIMIMAGIFSVIGNWSDFEAIKKAPNPGYPVAIRNASILPITFLSIILFSSDFNPIKIIGVFFILGGIILLVVDKKKSLDVKKNFSNWPLFAFLALFCFAITKLAQKQATLSIDFSIQQINLFIFGFDLLAFIILTRKEFKSYFKDKTKLKKFIPLVALAATFSFLANFFGIKGFSIAPNPGYHEAVKNTSVLFVALLSVKLFSANFDRNKIIGTILTVIGIIILAI